MSESDTQTPASAGVDDHHTRRLRRRTAAVAGAFFLPHLRSGMRVLDVGCGPGTITVGLAQAVRPGEVVGIDLDANRLAMARSAAVSQGIGNVSFQEGGIHQLAFPDQSFDAALVHAVLEHIPDQVAALSEVRRVLKPGGVIGVRSAEHGAAISWPPSEGLARFISLMAREKEAVGQNLFI